MALCWKVRFSSRRSTFLRFARAVHPNQLAPEFCFGLSLNYPVKPAQAVRPIRQTSKIDFHLNKTKDQKFEAQEEIRATVNILRRKKSSGVFPGNVWGFEEFSPRSSAPWAGRRRMTTSWSRLASEIRRCSIKSLKASSMRSLMKLL